MKMLRRYDPHQEYFLYPETICKPAPYEISDDMASCPHDFSERDDARVIILTKGGKALSQFQPSTRDYPAFFRSLTNLFHGLQHIHAAGLAHNDIKPDNVVTRKKTDGTYTTKFIDFGLMASGESLARRARQTDDIMYKYDILQSNYRYWSFDMRFTKLAMIQSAMAQSDKMMKNVKKYYDGLSPDVSFPYKAFSYPALTRTIAADIARQLSVMPTTRRHAFIMTRSDILGLGLTIAQVYFRLTGHRDDGEARAHVVIPNLAAGRGYVELENSYYAGYHPVGTAWHTRVRDEISLPLYNLVRRMIHVNPFRRITRDDALAAYEAILPRMALLFSEANIAAHLNHMILRRADDEHPVLFAPALAASSSPLVAAAAAAEDDVVLGFEQSPLLSASPEKIPRELAVSSTSSPSSGLSWRRRSLNTLSLSSNSSGTRRRRIREHGFSPRRTRKNS